MRNPNGLTWLEITRLRIQQINEQKQQGRELTAREKYQKEMQRNIEICKNTRSAQYATT